MDELYKRMNEVIFGNRVSTLGSWSKIIGDKDYDFRVTQTIKKQGSWVRDYSYTNFCASRDGSFSKAIATKSMLSQAEVEELFIPFITN